MTSEPQEQNGSSSADTLRQSEGVALQIETACALQSRRNPQNRDRRLEAKFKFGMLGGMAVPCTRGAVAYRRNLSPAHRPDNKED